MSLFINEVKTNKLITEAIQFDTAIAPSVTINTLRANTIEVDTLTLDEAYADSDAVIPEVNVSSNASVQQLTTNVLNCVQLNTNQLNVPDYVITTLFADRISATQTVQVDTYTPAVHKNTGLTRSQQIAIAFGVLAAVALIALVVISLGTAAPAVAPVAGFMVAEASYSASSAALVAAIAAENAIVVGAATAITASSVAAGVAGITIVASAIGVAGAMAAHALIPPSAPDPVDPVLRPKIINSTYGKSFLSDMIFGTTSYRDATAAYVNFLLVQNQVNGSYALPRILAYNPQLGFFDDGTFYGGVSAYLSICTNINYTTLRYEDTGNLAIYTSTAGAPVWESATQVSSIKYKKNIRLISNPLEKIQQLDVIRFKYKGEDKQTIGVIAQQVLGVLEEAVYGGEDEGYRVRLEKLIPLIIEGMKEVYLKQEEIIAAARQNELLKILT